LVSGITGEVHLTAHVRGTTTVWREKDFPFKSFMRTRLKQKITKGEGRTFDQTKEGSIL